MQKDVHAIDLATTLTGTPGEWTATIQDTWFLITDIPHGGVSAALLMQAAQELDPDRRIRTFTGQLMAPLLGELTVRAKVVRSTRSLSVVSVEASANGSVAAMASVVLGSIIPSTSRRDFAQPPQVPLVAELPDLVAAAPDVFPRFIREHVDFRPALGTPFAGGDSPELAGWLRPRTPRALDDRTVAVLLDALPSAISAIADGFKIAPTVEFSIAFDQAAIAEVGPEEWTLCHAQNWAAGEGWSLEDADLFSSAGVLLGKGRQLRRLGF